MVEHYTWCSSTVHWLSVSMCHCKTRLYFELFVHNNNCFTALCPGLPWWVGMRRNTRLLTYLDHRPSFISFFHLLLCIASSLFNFTCLTIFLFHYSLSPLCSPWSSSWSGALYFPVEQVCNVSCYAFLGWCLHGSLPSMLWHCWLGVRKSIQPVNLVMRC